MPGPIFPVNSLTVFAGLDMLCFPTWHVMNNQKMTMVLGVLENQLALQAQEFGLIERHRARQLLRQIAVSDLIVKNSEFSIRVERLEKLLARPEEIHNSLLLKQTKPK